MDKSREKSRWLVGKGRLMSDLRLIGKCFSLLLVSFCFRSQNRGPRYVCFASDAPVEIELINGDY